MRILFLENRTATLVWQAVAEAFAAQGHDVHWMVQNRRYAPRAPNVQVLPYPRLQDLSDAELDPQLLRIRRSDRGIRHFGGDAAHYHHYRRHIHAVLAGVQPQVVFGESTNFHELMTIDWCQREQVPYVAPLQTRYPGGRTMFHLYTDLEPVGGEGRPMDEQVAERLMDGIVARRTSPAYMKPPSSSWSRRWLNATEKMRLIGSWVDGERFLTPSPLRHLMLGRERDRVQAEWDALAASRASRERGAAWVLYPLQMQPESNLDVFGQPWNDQHETVARAARALADAGATLLVKPNPKSKYEMNAALLETVRQHDNVVPLSHSSSMQEFFPSAPLVLAVTGTVILECIFAGKPVGVLGNHRLASLPGVSRIDAPEAVAGLLRSALTGQAPCATRPDALATLQWLHQTSYPACIFEPRITPERMHNGELQRLQRAFLDVLEHVRTPDAS